MFNFGYAFQSLRTASMPFPFTKQNNAISSPVSTWKMLDPQPMTKLYHQMVAVDVEEYQLNEDQYRQQAILRAATSSIKLGKNEDGTIWVDTESLTNPEAALAKKRTTGGETQISWQHVDSNLSLHNMAWADRLDNVGYDIDYFASEYAQYKTRIEHQHTGEERKSELEKLAQLFDKHVKEAAENFAQQVGQFLGAHEQEAIRNSFLDIYEQRKTDYLNFVEQNPDYAGVRGTEDEWLLTSGDFMGEQLRYTFISQKREMDLTSNYGYSIDDLQATGTLVKELANARSESNAKTKNRSEEELGVELGMVAMKYEFIAKHFNTSGHVKSKLDLALQHFIEQEIEKVSHYIDEQRQDPFVRNKEAYAKDYDKESVSEIIKQMVKNLSANDINAAFRSNLNIVFSLYKEKNQTIQSGNLARYNDYYSSWTQKNYASDWNQFVRQLSSINKENLDPYLFKNNPAKWMNTTI